MKPALKALFLYLALLLALWPVFEEASGEEPSLPPLPCELLVRASSRARDFCGSDFFERSLASRAFRWVTKEEPVWKHHLELTCDDSKADTIGIVVTADGKRVFHGAYGRAAGIDSDNTTAAVIARLLPLQPAVRDAALRAYLDNQPDVARLGADLWRARRWAQAAEHLAAALENNWPDEAQADLRFGLADAYAHLGRPRQAFWHALCYAAVSDREPPREWVRSLRGAAGLLASQAPSVEPQAEELARRWRRDAGGRRWEAALEDLKRLSMEAPWADSYQDAMADLYARLGWEPLARSWRRRAAFTRRLAGDAALQARVAALLR